MQPLKSLLLLTALLSLSVAGYSQEEEQQLQFPLEKTKMKSPYKWNVIKVAPIALFMGQIPYAAELRVIYELAVSPRNSIFVGASLNFQNVITRSIWDNYNDTLNQYGGNYNFTANIGYRVQGGYKFFLLKKQHAPEGLFVGPHLSFNRLKVTDKNNGAGWEKAWITYLNFNIIAGYQLIAGRFVLEAVTGLGYRKNYVDYFFRDQTTNQVTKVRDSWYPEDRAINHVKFSLSLNLGVAF